MSILVINQYTHFFFDFNKYYVIIQTISVGGVMKKLFETLNKLAKEEIEKYGKPSLVHYDISIKNGIKLAKQLNADVELVKCGIALMDIKLGEAATEGKQPQHTQISKEYAEKVLTELKVDEQTKAVLLNCVAAHHGKVPFETLEAQIVANADCYRFICPQGVFEAFAIYTRSGLDHNKALEMTEMKLDEKFEILSLKSAKEELDPYYYIFKDLLNKAKV